MKPAGRIGRIATFVLFGIGCLLIGFIGNESYYYWKLQSQGDPDALWGRRAQFYQAQSFGGFVDAYQPQKSLTVHRDKTVYTFRLVSTTQYLFKPDVGVIAPGAEVQVKFHKNPLNGEITALSVRLISRSMFK
ncbi:MAG: hypothetical protein ACYCW6_20655 [Candidatus Xenobia bacterium]